MQHQQKESCASSSSSPSPSSGCATSSSSSALHFPAAAAPAAAAAGGGAAVPHVLRKTCGAEDGGAAAAEGDDGRGAAAARAEKEREAQRQPLSPEWVHERTGKRIEYFEVQQLTRLEKKERDAIREHIGREIRDKCRAELDDYYDCMVDRSLTFLACKSYANVLQRCVKKYEQPEVLEKRWQEVREERERLGIDGIRRHSRKQYNKYVTDANPLLCCCGASAAGNVRRDGTGWLPKRKSSPDQSSALPPRP